MSLQTLFARAILNELQEKINSWESNEDLKERPAFYRDGYDCYTIKIGYHDNYSINFHSYSSDEMNAQLTLSRFDKYSVTIGKSEMMQVIDFMLRNLDAETKEDDYFIQELSFLYNDSEAVIA